MNKNNINNLFFDHYNYYWPYINYKFFKIFFNLSYRIFRIKIIYDQLIYNQLIISYHFIILILIDIS